MILYVLLFSFSDSPCTMIINSIEDSIHFVLKCAGSYYVVTIVKGRTPDHKDQVQTFNSFTSQLDVCQYLVMNTPMNNMSTK